MSLEIKSFPPSGMKSPSRFITTHNAEGKAIFTDRVVPVVKAQEIDIHPMHFRTMYTCSTLPAQFSGDNDIAAYIRDLESPPDITIPGGIVARVVDFPPDYISAMHRTLSLDFGIVIDGEIELVLDSGETRKLTKGDTAVQRGTNHAWKNITPAIEVDGKKVERWARMFFVLETAEPIQLADGQELMEDFGGIVTA